MRARLKRAAAAGLGAIWLAAWFAVSASDCAAAAAVIAGADPAGSSPAVEFRLAAGRPTGPGQLEVSVPTPSLSPGSLERGQLLVTVPVRGKKGRAWIEWGGFVALVTVQYWTSAAFPEDRDFRLTLDDQIPRVLFLDGVRFDSNQFSLNWSHILGGAMYYQFGRANRLSWGYSWLMALAGSTWWEVVAEPKEVIAVNDQLLTGAGGFPLGEAWFQAGRLLLHRPRGWQRVLSVINPVLLVNHWLDRKDPAAKVYVPPGWHDVSLFAGARRITAAGTAAATDLFLGAHVRLIAFPDYGLPGEVRRPLRDTYLADLDFDIALRGGRAAETRLYARAVPWGFLSQKIGADGRGSSLTFGLGSSFEYFKKRPLAVYDAEPVPVKTDLSRLRLGEPRAFTDKLAVVHLAGPVVDVSFFRRGLTLRATVEAAADFALVNATALNDYSAAHDIAGLKTTVFYYGYYYGFGGTLAARARLETPLLRLHGRAEWNAWGSIDALDRFQAEVTNNAHLRDARTLFQLGASLALPRTPVRLFAEVESVRRTGRLEEVRSVRRETKVYAGLAVSF